MVDVEQLKGVREELKKLILETNANPVLIRLAWHDSGTYDAVMLATPTRLVLGQPVAVGYLLTASL